MGRLEDYRATHRHPVNRRLHTWGIPLIAFSVPVFLWNWRWALPPFVLGWILQFVGHAYEGKQPKFFEDPLHLFVGVWWWFRKVTGREASATHEAEHTE